mmetsp:Transcript_2792/g.10650  ORF Transcript_2792/g.10650 Transcript_2792/m.10650 type:complete len:159 (-) Transcript_2792:227-703(-)
MSLRAHSRALAVHAQSPQDDTVSQLSSALRRAPGGVSPNRIHQPLRCIRKLSPRLSSEFPHARQVRRGDRYRETVERVEGRRVEDALCVPDGVAVDAGDVETVDLDEVDCFPPPASRRERELDGASLLDVILVGHVVDVHEDVPVGAGFFDEAVLSSV